jgi:hypothetical protein
MPSSSAARVPIASSRYAATTLKTILRMLASVAMTQLFGRFLWSSVKAG